MNTLMTVNKVNTQRRESRPGATTELLPNAEEAKVTTTTIYTTTHVGQKQEQTAKGKAKR